uniref:Uncharacterized protein n=1 Tax=viral metagenome TaxID=1070528 RepID=A0A6C0LZG2_9ZZZZ
MSFFCYHKTPILGKYVKIEQFLGKKTAMHNFSQKKCKLF